MKKVVFADVVSTGLPSRSRLTRGLLTRGLLTTGLPAILLFLAAPSGLAGQSMQERTEEGLQGAWRVVRMGEGAPAEPGSEWTPPGLLLFAGDHYSYTLVTRPRPGMPRRVATPEELLAVWGPFTANAGTFEISGDTLTRRPVVAKDPNAMGAGIFNRYTFRLSADTLWVTTVGTETGPARNPTTVRYERLR